MTQIDMIDKFKAYETEATFTRGNKMTTQVVAMDDIRTVVAEITEELANDDNTENEALHIDSVSFSLRDKFAMMAISGLTSATEQDGTWTGNDPETVAEEAYKIADAMIKARSNES